LLFLAKEARRRGMTECAKEGRARERKAGKVYRGKKELE